MPASADTVDVRAQGWRALAALHASIETALGRALQAAHGLSVIEYTVLDVLSRQDGWLMRMHQVAQATALSQEVRPRGWSTGSRTAACCRAPSAPRIAGGSTPS